jgi:hypothetical protein
MAPRTGQQPGDATPAGDGLRAHDAASQKQLDRQQRDAEALARRVAAARKMWRAAARNLGHKRVRAYLAARGVPVERLPDEAWSVLGFHPTCFDRVVPQEPPRPPMYIKDPAMVAAAEHGPLHGPVGAALAEGDAEGGAIELVHRTFLHPREARKRDEVEGQDGDVTRAKKMQGDRGRGPCIRLRRSFPGGVLVLTEGIETAAAVTAATGRTAWACLDVGGLLKVELPGEIFEPPLPPAGVGDAEAARALLGGGWVHTLIVAGELDRSGASQRAMPLIVERFRSAWPWINVLARFPSPEWAGELARVLKFDELRPCPTCERRKKTGRGSGYCPTCHGAGQVGWRAGEHQPAEGRKSTDWLDVLVEGPLGDDGLEGGILAGLVEAEAAARVVAAWRAFREAEAKQPPAAPFPSRASPGPRSAGGAGAAGAAGGARGGGRPPAGGPGGTGDTGSRGDGAGGDGRASNGCILPEGELTRARWFLEELYAPPREGEAGAGPGTGGGRAGSGFGLICVDGVFRRWLGPERGGWERIGSTPAMSLQLIRAQVRRWMAPFLEEFRDDVRACDASLRRVEAVAKAVADEVSVATQQERFWLRPTFDERGEALWGYRPWERVAPAGPGGVAAEDVIPTRGGLLDVAALKRGELRVLPHSPLFYAEGVIPYEVPVAGVRSALAGEAAGDGGAAWDALEDELCPGWMGFLFRAFNGERDPEGARENMRQLQVHAAYWLTTSVSHKDGNIAFLNGPGDTGKGTIAMVMMQLLGHGNYVMTSFDELPDKFHLAAFRGKRLAIIDESEAGDRSDVKRATRVLKTISGGSPVATRNLYEPERPSEQLYTRFLVLCNEIPDLIDRSGALLNRCVAYDFKVYVKGTGAFDPGLKDRIRDEVPGIFGAWAMRGLVEMGKRERADGGVFVQPASSRSPLEALRAYSADLDEFAGSWLSVTNDAEDWMGTLEILGAYEKYCESKRAVCNVKENTLSKQLMPVLRRLGWWRSLGAHTVVEGDGRKRRPMGYWGVRLSKVGVDGMAYTAEAGQGGGGGRWARAAKGRVGPGGGELLPTLGGDPLPPTE